MDADIRTTIACLGNCGDDPDCCGCLTLTLVGEGEWLVYCNESGRAVAVGNQDPRADYERAVKREACARLRSVTGREPES